MNKQKKLLKEALEIGSYLHFHDIIKHINAVAYSGLPDTIIYLEYYLCFFCSTYSYGSDLMHLQL